MGWLTRIYKAADRIGGAVAGVDGRSSLRNPSQWLTDGLAGEAGWSGEHMSIPLAMKLSTAWACVRAISEECAALPLAFHRRLSPRGSELVRDDVRSHLLGVQPNPDMTSIVFRETLFVHVLTHGNAFAQIVRNVRGHPLELWPIRPELVTVIRGDDGRLAYEIRAKSTDRQSAEILRAADMLHIPGMGFDGLLGLSPIEQHMQTLGLARAETHHAAGYLKNGARPTVALQVPQILDEAAEARLRRSWSAKQTGGNAIGSTAILWPGMTATPLSFNPRDSQLLDSRAFSVAEVARVFKVPPHKIGHLEKSTNNNIEAQGIDWVVGTLTPWLVRFEQEYNRKLVEPGERGKIFAKHRVQGLLRGDSTARSSYYRELFDKGALSPNDIRELEDLNPYEGGDIYTIQVNRKQPTDGFGEPDETAEPAADADRAAGPDVADEMVVNFRPLLAAAFGRSLRLQSDKVTRAIKRGPDRFGDWSKEFYDSHSAVLAGLLAEPVAALARAICTIRQDPISMAEGKAIDEMVGRFAAEHCQQQLNAGRRLSFDDVSGEGEAGKVAFDLVNFARDLLAARRDLAA